MSGHPQISIENSESWIGENADRIDNLAIRSCWQNPYFFICMVKIMVETGGGIKNASSFDCGK